MKNAFRIFAGLALVSLFALGNSEPVQSANADMELLLKTDKVLVSPGVDLCYNLTSCRNGATYSGAALSGTYLSVGNYYTIYYYNGGPCDVLIDGANLLVNGCGTTPLP